MNSEKAKVFFGCSMRGGHYIVSREELRNIINVIESNNLVIVSKHQSQENSIEQENLLLKGDIHDRDYNWLLEADCGIFEISNPSLGVGAEISDMISLKKPILCLYKKGDIQSISAYVLGKEKSKYINSLFQCCEYNSLEEANKAIKLFLKKLN